LIRWTGRTEEPDGREDAYEIRYVPCSRKKKNPAAVTIIYPSRDGNDGKYKRSVNGVSEVMIGEVRRMTIYGRRGGHWTTALYFFT
jgi:hypothetical protein